MKIIKAENGRKTIKISKSEWKSIGRKAQWMSSSETVEIGPVPNGEECSQVGSNDYDYSGLNKIEVKAYINQLKRMFPNIPDGCRFVMVRNEHDFGTYFEAGIKFIPNQSDESDSPDPNAEYAYNIENNSPENWDAEAISELEQQGYFQFIKRKI